MASDPVKALYLDTHILVWLYQDGAERLTVQGQAAIERAEHLLISPMVELELSYLQEIGRITVGGETILDTLRRDLGLETCLQPFAAVVGEAVKLNWTRDPFDRLIVAQAAHRSAALLTADQRIQQHYPGAMW